jgi:hypothetical protein
MTDAPNDFQVPGQPSPTATPTAAEEVAKAQAAAGHTQSQKAPSPTIFGVVSVRVNEMRITEGGKPIGKILSPTEVPPILEWLRSIDVKPAATV